MPAPTEAKEGKAFQKAPRIRHAGKPDLKQLARAREAFQNLHFLVDSVGVLAYDAGMDTSKLRAACYIRVSTTDQNSALQVTELRQYIEARGWELAGIYEDTMSGSKASRPGLNRLMADGRARRIDAVLVWKLDRFGRSLVDCLNNIQTLEGCGVRFIAITQGLDTDQQNPASRFLLHVLGAAAEFERSLIRERVSAGMKAARAAGKAMGRPRLIFDREQIHELRRKGMSIARISQQIGVSVGTVTRTLAGAA
jgi:DNA invertase Pin-like site-specific DNA recombinase